MLYWIIQVTLVSNMKGELKNFLKKQLHSSFNNSGTNISSLDLMSNTDSYSLYNENK